MAAGSSILDSVYGSYTSGVAPSANARFDALFDAAAATGSAASPSGLGGGYSRYRFASSSSSSPFATTYSSSYQSRLAPLPLSSTSSSSYSPSYDKYYTYLDDLSTLRSSSGRSHSYRPSRYEGILTMSRKDRSVFLRRPPRAALRGLLFSRSGAEIVRSIFLGIWSQNFWMTREEDMVSEGPVASPAASAAT